MAQRKTLACLALLICGLLLAGAAFATADHGLSWWLIGSGGGRATGVSYALDATLGQAVVGSSSSASGMLHAGFWPGAAAQPATATPSPTATPTGTAEPTSTATPTATSTAEPATPTATATRTGVPASPTPTATSTVELPPPTPVVVGLWQSWTNGNYVKALAVDGDHVWAGTAGGVVRWDVSTGSYTRYLAPHGLPDNYVAAVEVDDAGRLWFGLGTWNGGVTVYDDVTWTTFTQRDGLVSGWVNDVAIDGDGRKWIGTARGVNVLSDNGTPHDKADDTWTSFTAADGMASDRVHVAAVDGPNLVWFAHENDGVSLLDHAGTPHNKSDDVWTTFTPADGLAGNSVYAIVVDGVGRKWFGACGGVSVLDDAGTPHEKSDDTWTTFYVGDRNQGLAIDPWGRKWVATGWSGVTVLDDAGTPFDPSDDVWMTFTRTEGLVEDRAQAIAVSSGGTVWVGTDGGVGRMVSGVWSRLYLPLLLRK